jgi:predicted nucleic acid-binding protein
MMLDTTFLIDLHREFSNGRNGPAREFMCHRGATRFSISSVVAVEFLEGFEKIAVGERFLRIYPMVPLRINEVRQSARLRRHLRAEGRMIGDFDLLIGATAIVAGLPLITANPEHFRRLPDLEVIDYRA